jgi:hypothetical protein
VAGHGCLPASALLGRHARQDSDTQPDPYIDAMAAGHASEHEDWSDGPAGHFWSDADQWDDDPPRWRWWLARLRDVITAQWGRLLWWLLRDRDDDPPPGDGDSPPGPPMCNGGAGSHRPGYDLGCETCYPRDALADACPFGEAFEPAHLSASMLPTTPTRMGRDWQPRPAGCDIEIEAEYTGGIQ